jgi:hypothetical protein
MAARARSRLRRSRVRQREPRPATLLRALEHVYVAAREDPILTALRQRLAR